MSNASSSLSTKNTQRAQRRRHARRLQRVRKHYWGRDGVLDGREIGKVLHTAAPCTCTQCGNPRTFRGELTVQELSHRDILRQGLDDLARPQAIEAFTP